MAYHRRGAKQSAKIIMNGRERLDTEYGSKSEEGVADLIGICTESDTQESILEIVQLIEAGDISLNAVVTLLRDI